MNVNKCSKKVVVDYKTDIKAVKTLETYGFTVIPTKQIKKLYPSVDGHADLQLAKVGKDIIVYAENYAYYKDKISENIKCGVSELNEKYPFDIAYNVAVFGKYAVHYFRFTDSVLRECIKKNFLFEIETKQGYSKCSICIVSDNAIITEDENIIKSLKNTDIDILKIEKGSVKLNGMNYGFFGGATGLYDNKLFVNGELKFHSDKLKIEEFCKKHQVEIIELKKGEIYDIGSIMFI